MRELLAQLGFRSIEEAVGHVEVLKTKEAVEHWKAEGLDLRPILHRIETDSALHCVTTQDHGLDAKLDNQLIEQAAAAIADGTPVTITGRVSNVDRTVGTMLGNAVTKATLGKGLPEDTIDVTLIGTGGQSFGAFLPRGVTLRLIGDTNDYFGKGLSGGRLIVRPDEASRFVPAEQIIAGNVIGYGATSGGLFIRGQVGERFCVRNSGASAVVEGVGDHALEYMTGGEALIVGPTGRNVAAGMSGGLAWILDLDRSRLNTELVDAAELTDSDVDRIATLLRKHAEATGSTVAQSLLDEGPAAWAGRFTKVLPRDYARVIAARDQAAADGLDEHDTTQKMMEAAHG